MASLKVKIMEASKVHNYIKDVLENMPTGWLNLTTHRLDIYDEKLAKTQFLEQFENLFNDNNSEASALKSFILFLSSPIELEIFLFEIST